MNFKKYHVSRNLFDMSFYEGKSGITVSGNKATGMCDRFYNIKLSIPPELYGQELTWSAFIKRPDNPNTVRLQTADNGSYKYGNNIAGEGRSTVSFTATSTIRLYVNYANTGSDTIELSDITLNTGSAPLPYEPYGDSWHDIPHYIHNTSTDTITTPADIYANDTTATVGLKGNMEQSGIPTPTTPIQPSECGDLETSGTKAGQYKIPISSNSTTTPVYLGEVQSARRIKKLVFDGTENVTYNARSDTQGRWVVTIPTPNGTTTPENVICTHFKTVYATTEPLTEGGICMRSTGVDVVVGGLYTDIGITAPSDSNTIVNAVKAYLAAQYAAGTPVTVYYVLATAETGIVNEPLQKIGDYADEVSNISIPVTAGGDTISIGTTVQPSEVSVNYKGWHPVADVHEAENGAWT